MKYLYTNLNLLKNLNCFGDPRTFLLTYIISGFPATYTNKKCLGVVQCTKGKARSFQDLFKLTKTYFPSIKLDEFAYIFIDIMRNESDYRQDILDVYDDYHTDELYDMFCNTEEDGANIFTFIYCPNVRKVVIYLGAFNWISGDYALNFDCYGYGNCPDRHTNGGRLSFENILKIANSYEEKIKAQQ